MSSTVFLETTGERHALLVGGVTALERAIRAAAKAGATHVVVAAPPFEFPRVLPVSVEFAGFGAVAPEGARVERADVVAGIELVDEAARAQAEWKLIRGMNKSFEGPVDALINWRFSMRITSVLSRMSLAVTPNHVTVAAILVGLTASVLASRGTYVAFAIAGVLLQINSILDSVDGELARLRFQYSKVGQWLDNLSDDIVDNLFLAVTGVALGGVWFYIGVGAALGRVLVSVSTYVSVYRQTGTGDIFAFRWWFESADASVETLYSPTSLKTWFRSFGRRDTFVFIWMIALLAHCPQWVLLHGALISLTNLTLLVFHFSLTSRRQASR